MATLPTPQNTEQEAPSTSPSTLSPHAWNPFKTLASELRLLIFTCILKTTPLTTTISLLRALTPLPVAHEEALHLLITTHTFTLGLRTSIEDIEWLPSFLIPRIQRLKIDCEDKQVEKIGVSRIPNLRVGREVLRRCEDVGVLEVVFGMHPERWLWAAMVELLEGFPLLNQVVFRFLRKYVTEPEPEDRRRKHATYERYLGGQDVEFAFAPLENCMTVKGDIDLDPHESQPWGLNGIPTMITWKCKPGQKLLDTKDFDRTRIWGTKRERSELMWRIRWDRHERDREDARIEREWIQELNKLSLGDPTADLRHKPDLDLAEMMGRVCEDCGHVWIRSSQVLKHRREKHPRCCGCRQIYDSLDELREHYMYLPTQEQDEERERRAPCDRRRFLQKEETRLCDERFFQLYGHSLRPMVLESVVPHPFQIAHEQWERGWTFWDRIPCHSRRNPVKGCCFGVYKGFGKR